MRASNFPCCSDLYQPSVDTNNKDSPLFQLAKSIKLKLLVAVVVDFIRRIASALKLDDGPTWQLNDRSAET